MKKLMKLLLLLLLNISVYFIYNSTKNSIYTITSIGDSLSLGVNSYEIEDYSYTDYYRDYMQQKNKKVKLIESYSKKDLTIEYLLQEVKTNNAIKKDLSNSNILFLTIGYNDLIYKINIEENMTINKLDKIIQDILKDYKELLQEIRKYYKRKIIVIGYYHSNQDDYYINKGIVKLNKTLRRKNITYIDTYNMLNSDKYFSNPNSYFPNSYGYKQISDKIIKTLEKKENL